MRKIQILEKDVSSKIAAGEVIEGPISVVKELVENSIDAGSKNILVEIEGGGKKNIKVVDDGEGILKGDIALAFQRHATSKIRKQEDIYNINTLGFRGEALASIASVSKLELITKTKNEATGTRCKVIGGVIEKIEEAPANKGCSINVKDLFYNTPARLKFLKSNTREVSYITDFITKLSIGSLDISYRLINDGKEIFYSSGNGDPREVFAKIFGFDVAKNMISIYKEFEYGKISGFISHPKYNHGNRNREIFFVNGRFIKDKGMSAALERSFKSFLTVGRFPIAVIFVKIDSSMVDVNVHPSKIEIKFQKEKEVYKNIYTSVSDALKKEILIPKEDFTLSSTMNLIRQKPKMRFKTQPNRTFLQDEYLTTKSDKMVSSYVDIETEATTSEKTDNAFLVKEPQNTLNNNKTFIKESHIKYNKNKKIIGEIVGQIFDTYIIAQGENKFFLIDQHAAHERILFEKLSKNINPAPAVQKLVSPYSLAISASEMIIFEEFQLELKKMGFDASIFGTDMVLVRAVPYFFSKPVEPTVIKDILNGVNDEEFAQLDSKDRFIASMACHAAIRAKHPLTIMEMQELLKQLNSTENPYTCPHGRPTIISMDLYEIEKKFKRIQ